MILIQSIFDCSNYVLLLIKKIKGRGGHLNLKYEKSRPSKRRNRPGTKKFLTKGFRRLKLSKIRDRLYKWWKRARKAKNKDKKIFINLCYLHVLVIICFLLQYYIQSQFFFPSPTWSSCLLRTNKENFVALRCYLFFSLCQAIMHFSKQYLQRLYISIICTILSYIISIITTTCHNFN